MENDLLGAVGDVLSINKFLTDYGVEASQAANIVELMRRVDETDKDVGHLISAYESIMAIVEKPDFLKSICEKACEEERWQVMESAWNNRPVVSNCTVDLEKACKEMCQCVRPGDTEGTSREMVKKADKIFAGEAKELAKSQMTFDGVRVLLQFAECFAIYQALEKNDRDLVHVRDDLERYEKKYVPGVLQMLEGKVVLDKRTLEGAKEDFSSVKVRLESAKAAAEGARRRGALAFLSATLDLANTVKSVGKTWSVLGRGTQCLVGGKAALQGVAMAASGHLAVRAHMQVGEISLLLSDVDAKLAKIEQAQAKLAGAAAKLGGA